jgi:hypothetical protein
LVATKSLILVQIFSGDIVLGDFVGVDFALVGVAGVFHALYHLGFERISFFEELIHAFGIYPSRVRKAL